MAQEGLQLKPQHALGLAAPADPSALPVFLEADRLRGHSETEVGAEEAILVDCRPHLVHEGLVALRCGAFHVSSGGKS